MEKTHDYFPKNSLNLNFGPLLFSNRHLMVMKSHCHMKHMEFLRKEAGSLFPDMFQPCITDKYW